MNILNRTQLVMCPLIAIKKGQNQFPRRHKKSKSSIDIRNPKPSSCYAATIDHTSATAGARIILIASPVNSMSHSDGPWLRERTTGDTIKSRPGNVPCRPLFTLGTHYTCHDRTMTGAVMCPYDQI
ncbi:hypothetical protein ElyMa_004064000 [Elysia marginata]|uniref:Uncharacterized protein n=1 Tax=Elysia marginata TaxID=1093978 RepID=A0AAV4G9F7_9GAST|nr:hypothetical protein ElyMa_004064000 [Elysia marginata]